MPRHLVADLRQHVAHSIRQELAEAGPAVSIDSPSFTVTGSEGKIDISSHGMSPKQIAVALRATLASVYEDIGVEVTPDDLTLANMAMRETHESVVAATEVIDAAEKARAHYRRGLIFLYVAVAVNVTAALVNLLTR